MITDHRRGAGRAASEEQHPPVRPQEEDLRGRDVCVYREMYLSLPLSLSLYIYIYICMHI